MCVANCYYYTFRPAFSREVLYIYIKQRVYRKMGKQKKTRKFAEVKRMLNPKDIA